MQILLLEDDPSVRQALARSLGRAGHDVFVAESVAEAQDVAMRRHRHDLIVSDFFLPDGNGADFMRWLRGRCEVPGIAISGDADPGIRDLCLRSGFSTFLSKPVLAETLEEAIRQLLLREALVEHPCEPHSSDRAGHVEQQIRLQVSFGEFLTGLQAALAVSRNLVGLPGQSSKLSVAQSSIVPFSAAARASGVSSAARSASQKACESYPRGSIIPLSPRLCMFVPSVIEKAGLGFGCPPCRCCRRRAGACVSLR